MERFLLSIILIPLAAFFTGIGVYAWNRNKPMWFWSGSTVSEREITDVHAYNRANGIMWICYSLIFWIAAVLGIFQVEAAGILTGLGAVLGAIGLIVAYNLICKKYRR